VVCSQNHDQVGNRMLGDRLSGLAPFEALKLAAGVVLLAPFLPLLFMGEEYGEPAPFLYFVDHSDPALIEAVRKGRREEFLDFHWGEEPPDPQSEDTFQKSKLNHGLRRGGAHKVLYDFYRELLRLRRSLPALAALSRDHLEVIALSKHGLLCWRRWAREDQAFAAFHFHPADAAVAVLLPAGLWTKALSSADARWRPEAARPAAATGASSFEPVASAPDLPASVSSDGEVVLRMAPTSFVLFTLER
jgi:maltooligosyltrehalose trehalohydrolase